MNTTIIEKINSIITALDKEYGEWMDKKDGTNEEEMEIFKKHLNEFLDLYDQYEIEDGSVEDKLILAIEEWITITVGEIYIYWDTDITDNYDPGLSLKAIVEKYTKGE